MTIRHSIAGILIFALAASFCVSPALAQNTSPPTAPSAQSQSDVNTNPTQVQTANPSQAPEGQSQVTPSKPTSGTTVNPSQPPLQPVTTYPDAAGGQPQTPDAPQAKPQQAGQGQQPQNEPQGAAAAERVAAAGGAAAKPAGVAIAPPKQHQTRSLLIKLGAVAAGAVAAGTVYALSRGTSSTPPGANGPGAMQKNRR